jgi:hypothetical protein
MVVPYGYDRVLGPPVEEDPSSPRLALLPNIKPLFEA